MHLIENESISMTAASTGAVVPSDRRRSSSIAGSEMSLAPSSVSGKKSKARTNTTKICFNATSTALGQGTQPSAYPDYFDERFEIDDVDEDLLAVGCHGKLSKSDNSGAAERAAAQKYADKIHLGKISHVVSNSITAGRSFL